MELAYTILAVSALSILAFSIMFLLSFYLYLVATGWDAKWGALVLMFYSLVALGPAAYLGYLLIITFYPFIGAGGATSEKKDQRAVQSIQAQVSEESLL